MLFASAVTDLVDAVQSAPVWWVSLGGLIIGSGGLVAWYRQWGELKVVRAKAERVEAETHVIEGSGIQARYDKLFDELQGEVGRLRAAENECRATLDQTMRTVADLRMTAAEARVAVMALQNRVLRIEDQHPDDLKKAVRTTVAELMSQSGALDPKEHT